MKLKCPACGAGVEAGADGVGGGRVMCPACKCTFTAPAAGEEPAAGQGPPPAAPAAPGLGAAAEAVSPLAGLPIVRDLVEAFQPLLQAFSKLGDLVKFAGKKGGGGGTTLEAAEGAAGAAEGAAGAEGALAVGAEGALAAGAAGGPVGVAAAAIVGVVTGVVETFSRLTAVAGQFVGAINPSVMEAYSRAQHDLSAVIGQMLLPVMTTATSATRDLADTLFGVSDKVRPLVASLAETFGGVLASATKALGTALEALAPVGKALADAFSAFGTAFQGVIEVFRGAAALLSPVAKALGGLLSALLVPLKGLAGLFRDAMTAWGTLAAGMGAIYQSIATAIGGMFGGLGSTLQSFGTTLKEAVQHLLKFTLTLAATVAKLFGQRDAVTAMIEHLEGRRRGSVGLGVANNAQVTSLGAWSNSLMAAAYTARPVGPGSEERGDTMGKILDVLKEIRDGENDGLEDVIVAAIRRVTPTASSTATYVGGGAWNLGAGAWGLFGKYGGFVGQQLAGGGG